MPFYEKYFNTFVTRARFAKLISFSKIMTMIQKKGKLSILPIFENSQEFCEQCWVATSVSGDVLNFAEPGIF